ncbi:MAG TPA: hypothetical protein VL500_06760 [Candidatus Eisenbacteria bacterium]|nr:hypothetical protein [Candidatus Eisenbacteria bacterium]
MVITETEGRALDLLTNCITNAKLPDREEDRLVDPVAAVRGVFECLEEAEAFVEKLVKAFVITPSHIPDVLKSKDVEGRDSLLTFIVSVDRWLPLTDLARVPDPPFRAEERRVRAAIALKRGQRQALADRKAALERELEAVRQELAAADAGLATAEKTVAEFAEWRRRLDAIIAV